ncbi:MAG: hypothetical protein C5B58_10405, partial [Acidobacteria bacterium]
MSDTGAKLAGDSEDWQLLRRINERQSPSKSAAAISVHEFETMGSAIASGESCPNSFNLTGFPARTALPTVAGVSAPNAFASKGAASCDYHLMTCAWCPLKPLLAGLVLTLLQLAMAMGLLAPEGSISERYSTLIQHDSYWFMNIVNRGYQTIVPPIDHKVMEVSNVAFFPAYPAIAAAFRYGFNISTGTALLITAQLA